MTLKVEALENIVGKWKNADDHFILFSTPFLPYQK